VRQSYITYLLFLIINTFTAKLFLWQFLCFNIVLLLAYKLLSLFANRFIHLNSIGKTDIRWCGKVSWFVVACNSGLPSSKADEMCLNACISTLCVNMMKHIVLHTVINRFRNVADQYIYNKTAKFRLSFVFRTVTVSSVHSKFKSLWWRNMCVTFVLNCPVCMWF